MKANWLPLSAALALAISSVSASAVDFHGYFRAGMNANVEGGDVVCTSKMVGRLGNECDTFADLSLNQEVYNKANSKFTVYTTLTHQINNDTGDSWQGGNTLFREMYAKYDTASGYSIWAGKRFYQRKDIHWLDNYYLNNSGNGVGIENIDVGLGNLNFAVLKNIHEGIPAYKFDTRLNAIPVGFGSLDAAVIVGVPLSSKTQRYGADQHNEKRNDKVSNEVGVAVTLDHLYSGNSIMNHFVVQYGNNGFAGYQDDLSGYEYQQVKKAQSARIIDWGTLDIGDFGLGYSFIWGHRHQDEVGEQERKHAWMYSVVLRPEYKWTNYTRTTLELGYTQQRSDDGEFFIDNKYNSHLYKDPELYKITIAQQFTPGKSIWSRPAIRFFASYVAGSGFAKDNWDNTGKKWNDGYASSHRGNTSQVIVGTQVEAWW